LYQPGTSRANGNWVIDQSTTDILLFIRRKQRKKREYSHMLMFNNKYFICDFSVFCG